MGEVFRQAREALGWSLRQVADKVGVSHVTIRAIEYGHWEPTAELSGKLCHALGINRDPWMVALMAGRLPRRVTQAEAQAIVVLLRAEGRQAVQQVKQLS